jgi:predicted 2-oxoglutarate/Fe(II)-dependent dioxygenase YbiX
MGFEYVQFDNMYSDVEVSNIMAELDFLRRGEAFLPPEQSQSALGVNGAPLKKNKAVILDTIYARREVSAVLAYNRKLFSKEIPYDELSVIFNALRTCSSDSTVLSYYEDSDYYLPHADGSALTALTYFYREPKQFSGGELVFPKHDTTLPPLHNTTYLFCGQELHGVNPIRMNPEDVGKGLGRYCMAQFLSFKF